MPFLVVVHVKGFGFCEGLNLGFSHRKLTRPLQQCLALPRWHVTEIMQHQEAKWSVALSNSSKAHCPARGRRSTSTLTRFLIGFQTRYFCAGAPWTRSCTKNVYRPPIANRGRPIEEWSSYSRQVAPPLTASRFRFVLTTCKRAGNL
jgi:hypothetical protein